MIANKDYSERQLKINGEVKTSICALQKQFKLTFDVAQTVITVLKELKLDHFWNDPKEKLPPMMLPVLVEGKDFKPSTNQNEVFIAVLNPNEGWVKKDTNELLYVERWMEIPKGASLE